MRWSFDRLTGYRPGEACATRDMVEDLYQMLYAKNIPAESVQAQFVRANALATVEDNRECT